MTTLRNLPRRRAVVLLAVLIVVVLLSLAAYQYSELMTAEYHAATSAARASQARAAAESGIWYAAALLSNTDNMASLTGNQYDNASTFQDVAVGDTGANGDGEDAARRQMKFSLVTVRDADDPLSGSQPFRFGVGDESGKINLNALLQIDSSGNTASQMLMTLPNMTQDVANSILDWIDADDNTRQDGAESDYYSTQSPPYQCKNGPLDSLEEMLLIKGVTPQLLFGSDRNRNGILDPGEDSSGPAVSTGTSSTPNTSSGQVDRGWAPYLTVYSRESNVDSAGNPRIYLNDSNLGELQTNLTAAVGQELTNFILAYRLYGGTSSGGGSSGGGSSGGGSSRGTSARMSGGDTNAVSAQISSDVTNNSSSGRRLTKITSLFSLVNATVSVPVKSGNTTRSVSYPSPLGDPAQQAQLLPLLLDETTTSPNAALPGRINVNTASQVVLSALPGLADADVQAILTNRPQLSDLTAPDPIYQTPAWLITKANLTPSKLQTLENYITARTQVYRVQSLGYSAAGGPVSRLEAVIDTNMGRPRVLYWRDLSELGKGFDLTAGNP
jgi:type II secretory pathway component PulK